MGQTNLNPRELNAKGLRIGVIAARYNPQICDGLLEGASRELQRLGLAKSEWVLIRVPGAFELPYLAKEMAKTHQYDALVCLGAVVRGETSHFDYVCAGVTQGLMQAMLDSGIPMAFGVLTTDNEAQALARAGKDEHNKGVEAVRTAVEMALLKKGL
jgi:6,7-dimethyl-8-ribityllumazine synthase